MSCVKKVSTATSTSIPSYGGGTISVTPSRAGSIVSPGIRQEIEVLLTDQLFNFIVTEANENILIDDYVIGGLFESTITQEPSQGGTITQRP
jgi:hypothetical protein